MAGRVGGGAPAGEESRELADSDERGWLGVKEYFPRVDSFSILFNHSSFEKSAVFLLERRIPGKNGEGTPRTLLFLLSHAQGAKRGRKTLQCHT